MLKRLSLPAFVVFTLLWVGCEGSPVPLSDPPSVAVDPALLGTWEVVAEDGTGADQASVFAFNANEYLVEYREATRADDGTVSLGDVERVRMFMTDVDGRTFVNVACIGCDDDEWFFMELSDVTPDRATLSIVSDDLYGDLGDGATPDQVLAELRQLLTEPDAVGDSAVFRRVTD